VRNLPGSLCETGRVVSVGLLHPGEMGAALGAALRTRGTTVLWASADRSEATARRATDSGLEDVGDVDELARRSDVIVSVCPPHAAVDLARFVSGFRGLFVDANAVSPATAREIAAVVEAGGARFVDGGIVGPPPRTAGTTRLYLSGPDAPEVARVFEESALEPVVISDSVGAASATKMAYAAWTKGTAALLLAVRALARAENVEPTLVEEWRRSIPELPEQSQRAARSAGTKGWRWVGEMEQIAETFAAAGLPPGFHEAARDVFARSPRFEDERDEAALERVLDSLA
jgi:3-hydroxyisobutyrate dehydrogenase-like beta-hydroxyacid dehydrogenase